MENGHSAPAAPSEEYRPPFGPEEVRAVPGACRRRRRRRRWPRGPGRCLPGPLLSLNSHHNLRNHGKTPVCILMRLQWRKMGHAMVDFIADYQAGVEQMPVRSQVQPGYLR